MICKICGKCIKKIHQNHEKSIRHQESLEAIQLFNYLIKDIKKNYLSKVKQKYKFYRKFKKPKYARTKFKKIDLIYLQFNSYKKKYCELLLYLLPFNIDIIKIIFSYNKNELWKGLLTSNNIVTSYLNMEETLSQEFLENVFTDLELGVELIYCQKQLIKYHVEYFEKSDNWSKFVKMHNESVNNIIHPKSYNLNIVDIYPKGRKRKWVLFINKLCDLNMNVSSIIVDYSWVSGIHAPLHGIVANACWLEKLYYLNTCLDNKYIYKADLYRYEKDQLMLDLFGKCLQTLWNNGSQWTPWTVIAVIYSTNRIKQNMYYLNKYLDL